jgi:ubiquinone/menaquinone biosynthesis C-methylase UbiE
MAIYRNHLFPAAYDLLMGLGKLNCRRAGALEPVHGKTLEIGVGTGLNLAFYPEHLDHLTGVEPNPGMLRRLRRKQAQHGIDLEIVEASADDLPFADRSFDTVVSTHVLCSLPDRAKALSEVRRVLRTGGRFVFLEHGLSPDPGVAKWQRRLNGIQKRFAVGCELDVAVDIEIRKAGFGFALLETGYLEKESRTHGYLYQGVAVPE